MAGVLVVLVVLDTFLTGVLLVRDANHHKAVRELTELCQVVEHDNETMAHEVRAYMRGAGLAGGVDA